MQWKPVVVDDSKEVSSPLLGVICIIIASCTSGFAGKALGRGGGIKRGLRTSNKCLEFLSGHAIVRKLRVPTYEERPYHFSDPRPFPIKKPL